MEGRVHVTERGPSLREGLGAGTGHLQTNRYAGSRPTVREQDHLKTPPSLLHVKYKYLRGLCQNAPRSRAESCLG
jgi:hypothetical protein